MVVRLINFILILLLPLSVNAVQPLEAKHRILFSEPIEDGKRWVYEIEIINSSESPLDQLELTQPDADSNPPFESHTLFVESLEGSSTLVVHWLLETADLNIRQSQQVTQSLFFRGRAMDGKGEYTEVELMSYPDIEWLESVSIMEVNYDKAE
ncbi:hypothetical protein I6Y12_000509 [Vibrio parahaemolyticus]|nr:hypothetical protein [Vibrio parahaemolyticus]EGQ8182983.1 hypothetical protein [Vibrio parahaemolyticus]EGQ8544790.1 hypothetical protein [Vibrio parahaemolyticus]EKQ5822000.1 hypothetical protein [Vibrio parahaemolyticus]